MVDGRRGVRAVWPAALVAGLSFALLQFAVSNYVSMQLTDIVASLGSAGVLVMFLRVWCAAGTRSWPSPRTRSSSSSSAP